MSYVCRLTPAEQQRVITLAAAGSGPAAIARSLGLPVSRIANTYARAVRDGHAPKRQRTPWRPWTPADEDQIIRLVEHGLSYDAIARKLKRTRAAIILKAKRLGTRITTTNATMSAWDVARQLGIPCAKVVTAWIRRGWLQASNAGEPSRPLWRITWDDLSAFLEHEAHWIAWRPERIPDLALREWALELRAHEERMLTHAEVARRYGVSPHTVGTWIDKGWLRAVRYGNRFIPESALSGWVTPCDRDRRARPMCWPQIPWRVVGTVGGVTFRKAA